MAKKVWFDMYYWNDGMTEPELIAKIKSPGLWALVRIRFEELYDCAGTKDECELAAQFIGKGNESK